MSANYIAKGLFQVRDENDKTPEEKEEEQILEAQKCICFFLCVKEGLDEKYNAQVLEDFTF